MSVKFVENALGSPNALFSQLKAGSVARMPHYPTARKPACFLGFRAATAFSSSHFSGWRYW
jgi:hypothetical protein